MQFGNFDGFLIATLDSKYYTTTVVFGDLDLEIRRVLSDFRFMMVLRWLCQQVLMRLILLVSSLPTVGGIDCMLEIAQHYIGGART